MKNAIVGVQMLTMLVLAVLFWRAGERRLAGAQVAYVIATVLLFTR